MDILLYHVRRAASERAARLAPRSGTKVEIFVNGTSQGSSTASAMSKAVNNGAKALRIGAAQHVNNYQFQGVIDDFRIVVGVALDGTTVPTAALT